MIAPFPVFKYFGGFVSSSSVVGNEPINETPNFSKGGVMGLLGRILVKLGFGQAAKAEAAPQAVPAARRKI